jgi:hypothetical protein
VRAHAFSVFLVEPQDRRLPNERVSLVELPPFNRTPRLDQSRIQAAVAELSLSPL